MSETIKKIEEAVLTKGLKFTSEGPLWNFLHTQ